MSEQVPAKVLLRSRAFKRASAAVVIGKSLYLATGKMDRGFTLIEVLVSLFILAIGMLGMTALQNEALRYNHAAFIESQAQFLLTDMVERIRANHGSDSYAITFLERPASMVVNCEMAACTSEQMAVWDLNQWRARVEDSAFLPQGESQIQFDSQTNSFVVAIRYDWNQLGGAGIGDGKRTLTVSTRI